MKRVWFLILLLCIPGVFGICSCTCNRLRDLRYPGPKEYDIDKAFIDMEIGEDGKIYVNETITFDFYLGKFSYAYRDFEVPVSEVSVTENGQKICYDVLGDSVKWYFDEKNNNKRTFTIHYTTTKVVTVYDDYSDFYMKIWGDEWAVPVEDIEGEITLPAGIEPEEVYTWGHPDLSGKIGMSDERTVVYQAFGVPENQWVELRVAYPSELMSSLENAERIKGDGLQKIIREERRQENQKVFIFAGLIIPPVIMIVVFVYLFFKFGREPKIEYDAEYEREIPYEYSPSIVSALLNQHSKKPGYSAFGAVVLDLVRRKYLELKKVKVKTLLGKRDDFQIRMKKSISEYLGDSSLTFSEKKVLRILHTLMDNRKITFSELKRKAKTKTTFSMMMDDWRSRVKMEIEHMDLLGENKHYQYFFIASVGLFVVGSILLFFIPLDFLFIGVGFGFIIAGVVSMLLNGILNEALPRRTPKGALHYKKWMALKRFLKDFSELKSVSTDAVQLWEQFLVYAIPLGVAKKVEKNMERVFKISEKNPVVLYGVTYTSLSSFDNFTSSINSFSSTVSHSASTSGSGGFSGGGGGGAGGGGGGAG